MDSIDAVNLLERLDLERLGTSNRLAADPKRRAELGQYFTPETVARFMAGMLQVDIPTDTIHILDAGGGSGILTAAAIAELCIRPKNTHPKNLHATIWEIDDQFTTDIAHTFDRCHTICNQAGIEFTGKHYRGNFILDAVNLIHGTGLFTPADPACFNLAILNPPYRKLRGDSVERSRLRSVGIETSNLYSAFVWLALKLLKQHGELVAITPRSFMNGSYFRPFRRALAQDLAFRHVHVYDTRNTAFASEDVLQENVIFHGVRNGEHENIKVTTSASPSDTGLTERIVDPVELILPHDSDYVLRLVPDETNAHIAKAFQDLPYTLADLGVIVSTGRVVSFRARERLRAKAGTDDIPLVFPRHFAKGFVCWPSTSGTKPNALAKSKEYDDLLLPRGWYVLVNRFTAKEERRRVVAALFDPARIDSERIAFDNKLNVLHRQNAGLSKGLAKGLAAFLNTTAVDMYFRQFSGHTQVNAADLRSLYFPSFDELEYLGRFVGDEMPSEDELNHQVGEVIPSMKNAGGSIAAKRKVQAAEDILKSLNAPAGQRNERSALALLGLLDLSPKDPWSAASAPLRGVTELMNWMRDHYGKHYQPNTREPIRRQTLHPFIEMTLIVANPDNPDRPPNSPHFVYQIQQDALELIRLYDTERWGSALKSYLASVTIKNRLNLKARRMERIPVTLPNGKTLELSAGGQNVLVKEIVEQFAPRFTPGGNLVYLGDTDEKDKFYDVGYLKRLGVEIDPHGKMPDVIIHHLEQNWLIIIEAVTSHGPVNALRHNQLKDLFAGSSAGLVFVTAFLDRSVMREYLPEIDWETEVWVADAPEHLIHFDGERFLGPYESD